MAGNAGWRAPSYGSVRSIVGGINPAMATLAHEGAAAFRDKYELVHRHRAAKPNATWQADHTQLDILILDASGKEARPWLTTVVDDHSRAVTGYMVMLGAPSALRARPKTELRFQWLVIHRGLRRPRGSDGLDQNRSPRA